MLQADILSTTKTPLLRASAVQPGDLIAVPWSKGYPGKVVKVGALTKTGKVTLHFEDGSRSTVKGTELLCLFTAKQIAEAAASAEWALGARAAAEAEFAQGGE